MASFPHRNDGGQDYRAWRSAAGEKSRIFEWIGKIRLIQQDKVPLLGCLREGTFLTIVSIEREVILSPDTAVAPVFKIGNRKNERIPLSCLISGRSRRDNELKVHCCSLRQTGNFALFSCDRIVSSLIYIKIVCLQQDLLA